jgi:hypothetical protein
MKKSIINRNYSLLVLLLLILYITYLNIPINTNMRGGDSNDTNNPYDSMIPEKLDKMLMKHSSLYAFLNNNFIIYSIITIILLIPALYYGFIQYNIIGVPMIGKDPALVWDEEGAQFLSDFFVLSRQKNGLNPPGTVKVDPAFLNNFDEKAAALINKQKAGIDLFCNIMAPCDICKCAGPDPNFAGNPDMAPIIPYGGPECRTANFTGSIIEGLGPSTTELKGTSDIINNYNQQFDYSHRVFGELPNCCCHIFNRYGVTPTNTSRAAADILTKKGTTGNPVSGNELSQINLLIPGAPPISNTTFPLGLPTELGCEPLSIALFDDGTGSKTLVPANKGNYALAMFQACLSTTPIKTTQPEIRSSDPAVTSSSVNPLSYTPNNLGLAPYDTNMSECFANGVINNTKLASDKGISANFMFRNEALWNEIKPRINKTSIQIVNMTPFMTDPTILTPSTPTWWAQQPNAPRWPTIAPFQGTGVVTSYYYNYTVSYTTTTVNDSVLFGVGAKVTPSGPVPITNTNTDAYSNTTRMEMVIDNYLKEVYLTPVTKPTNIYCTIDISTMDDANKQIDRFLKFGLTAQNDPTYTWGGMTSPTAYPDRYFYPKSGQFIFP